MCSRVFVVTGANKGIGFETVRELGKRLKSENANIVLCARDAIRGQEAVSKLAREGLKANLELLDIADEESRKRFVRVARDKYKHIDCLINNAGIALPRGSKQPLTEQARLTCAVNYSGTRDVTLALAPLLRPNAKVVFVASRLGEMALNSMSEHNRARLTAPTTVLKDIDAAVDDYVNTANDWKKNGWPKMAYAFSKAAVIALTAVLARQADAGTLCPKSDGIIVTACCPGWCKTDLAGWEDPPQSAEDGSQVVAQLALSATRKEHGRHIVEGRDIRIPSKL